MSPTPDARRRFLLELQQQANIAFPTTLALLLYKLPWVISIHFVGNLGPEELAAAALASTLCNVTGMSFSVGLSSAITTLTGQARGELILKGKTMVMRRKSLETTSREKNQTHGENHHERKIGE